MSAEFGSFGSPCYVPLSCETDPKEKPDDLFQSTETHIHFGQSSKDDQKLTPLQFWRFNLINMYVTDALNTRPPNSILEARGLQPGLCGLIPIHTAYKLSHNSFWSTFVYVSMWFHLGLILYEPYANIAMEQSRYPPYLYLTECLILLIYSLDVYLHYISHDKHNYWDLSWAKVITVCIVLNFVDIVSSLVVHRFLFKGFLLRFGAVLRPIFLICRSQFLRATVRSVFNAIPRVLDVLFLVCLYILMFAVLGYVLFSQYQLGIGMHECLCYI